MAITIEDIAKEAGVSIATVSRVMNNTKAVSDELRDRVNAVIEKNQFKPNSLARGLATNKTQSIGIIIPDISNPVFATLVKGANEICHKKGYTLMVSESLGERDREEELLLGLEEKYIDGVLLAGIYVDSQLVEIAESMEYPVVLIGQEDVDNCNKLSVVIHDNEEATYEATKLLIQAGHREIAYIGGPEHDYSSGVKRFQGYKRALEEEDIKANDYMVYYGDFTLSSGYKGMEKILEDNKDVLTAVIIGNDMMAIGAIRLIRGKGLQVPEDISIIGMDGIEIGAYITPMLTTIEFPYYEEGVKAANVLMDYIDGRQKKPRSYYLKHRLIQRESIRTRKGL